MAYHCIDCGGELETVEQGGCGGQGSIHRCTRCNRVFTQTGGGILGGDEGFSRHPAGDIETYRRDKGKGAPASAQVEGAKPQAEWVADHYNPSEGMVIRCSSCDALKRHESPNPKECLNCGAQMTNAYSAPKGWGQIIDSLG